jgi:glycosyltransferase involved in cell wall biosynthesis
LQSDRLTIVQVVAPAFVGGTESVVRGLAAGHHQRGHRVHVIGIVEPELRTHPYLAELAATGVTVHALHLRARAYLAERRVVREILAEIRPDVVHVHGYRPEFIDAPVARRLGIPVVTTLHGWSRPNRRSHAYEWIQVRMLRRYDAIVAVSGEIVREMRAHGVPANRLHCIPNGWVPTLALLTRAAAREELGVAANGILVGWVGRLIPIKGCDVFIRAFAECKATTAKAVVIGDGPERARLEHLTNELGLGQQVHFAGARAGASRLFSAFDLFVLSSRSEGTPITMLEGMAAGVPLVATAVGAIPDLVSEREALLVPKEDPVALGTAIRRSLDQSEKSRERAVAAKRRLDTELSADVWLARHEAVYRAIRRG